MRTITIKQFQQNIYKETQDLPVTVTRNGKPSFTINTPQVATIAENKPKKVATTIFTPFTSWKPMDLSKKTQVKGFTK